MALSAIQFTGGNAPPPVRPFFPGFEAAAHPGKAAATADHFIRREPAGIPRADVLAVLAHPDDELIMQGTLARLAEKGYSVQCVYATSGNGGVDVSGRGLGGQSLAAEREREQKQALAELGVNRPPVFLRYPDGEIAQDRGRIKDDLKTVMAYVQPDLVLTFGPDGLTGHPDHQWIGRLADEAAAASKLADTVYHMAFPRSAETLFRHYTGNPPGWEDLQTAPDDRLSVMVNVDNVVRKKSKAAACHATQFSRALLEGFAGFFAAFPFEGFVKGATS